MGYAQISRHRSVTDSNAAVRVDQHGAEFINLYAASHTKGQIKVVTYDGDEASNPSAVTPATSAVYQKVGVCTKTSATAGYVEYQIKGDCTFALVEGTTDVAKGDFLEVLNGETSLKKDATTRSVNSVAIAQAAQTADSSVATSVYLIGERVIIAAS